MLGSSMKKLMVGIVFGALASLAAVQAYEAVRYLSKPPRVTAQPLEKPLVGFSVDPSWVRTGAPNFRNAEMGRSPDGRTISGLWACDGPSTFEWAFSMDETLILLEGMVEVEYLGKRFTIRPGESATFLADTKAVWHVPAHVKKAYTVYSPHRVVRLWRSVSGNSSG